MNKEMKVYYSGNFWGHKPYEHAGKKIIMNQSILWAGNEWKIPAAYVTAKGLVIDLCRRIPREEIAAFYDKWEYKRADAKDMELFEQLKSENPFDRNVNFSILLNQHEIKQESWCSAIWQPCRPDHNGKESDDLMEAYEMEEDDGWCFYRVRFPWKGKRKPGIKHLAFILSLDHQISSCNSKFTAVIGCEPFDVNFQHPVTKSEYRLHVISCEKKQLDPQLFHRDDIILPFHYAQLNYYVTPELPEGELIIRDQNQGDRPVIKAAGSVSSCSSIGIIGGSDGPTVIFINSKEAKCRMVSSSFHFEPVSYVEWRLDMKVNLIKPVTLNLIDISQ